MALLVSMIVPAAAGSAPRASEVPVAAPITGVVRVIPAKV